MARSATEIPLADVFIRLAKCHEDVTVVIDALDECQDRRNILTLLRQLPSSIHLFVTSRDEVDIRRSFQSYPKLWEQEIRPDDVTSDIRNYIVRSLDDHLLQYPNFADRSLIHTVIKTLVKKANGMWADEATVFNRDPTDFTLLCRFLWVFFQVRNILECDTNNDIRDRLQNLPKGLEETFVRCLKQIDGHPSKNRLRRILRLVLCYESIEINDLVTLINVDEMDDHWSQCRTINDVSALISRCSHLITTITDSTGWLSITLSHFSVYQFLSSDPQSFDSAVRTLPQYHFYPIFDAYMAVANTFGRSHPIDGGPELLSAEAQFIARFHGHRQLLSRAADFLTTMFNVPMVENTQPSLVFPNATQVTLINCRFFEVLDEYYILTSQTSAKFSQGPYFWTELFPQPHVQCFLNGGELLSVNAACGIQIERDYPIEDFWPTDQIHVTLIGFDFVWARTNNWTIRPSVGIIRNKTTNMPMDIPLKRLGGSLSRSSGFEFCVSINI